MGSATRETKVLPFTGRAESEEILQVNQSLVGHGHQTDGGMTGNGVGSYSRRRL